ncbi:MAG: RidA family protein [Candidatus Lustribacter sp.]|jgi:2-iminobutanoate/2-iminopropanoate deaminase
MTDTSRKTLIPGPEGKTIRGGNSYGVKAGGFLFLSAVRGTLPNDGGIPPDLEEQARQLFRNVEATLKQNGATMADVVKVAAYMLDLEKDRPVFNKAWKEFFGDQPPARFAVQVSGLGNPGDGSRFLLDVIALAPAG